MFARKKTKSTLLSESSCSVLSEISGSETKQHSFHTELSPWQQIFLDWGNKGLCSTEVQQHWLCSAQGCGPTPCSAPREQLMGAVRGSAYPGLRGRQHQPIQWLWCHWGIDGWASSQAALWLSVHERQKQRLWSAEARFPTDFLFYLNPMSKANLETTGERASRNCRRCTDVRWEEEETGALGPACLRLSHREQCPELWPASLQFVGWNTQQANWCSCWSKTHGGTCGTDSVLFICSLNFRLHVWSEKINIHHLIHYIFFPNISQRKKQQGLGSLLCDGRCILSALSRCSVALQEVPPLLRSLNSLPSTLGGIHFEVRFATQTTKIRVFCSA